MHILVVSDSHGNTSNLKEAMRRHPEITRVLHCGDGEADVAALSTAYPSVRFDAVRGNCDLGALFPLQRLLRIADRRIFMTHGHNYGTKYGVKLLLEQGRKDRADVVLFGHTHRRLIERQNGILLVNPGSIGGRFPARTATYVVLDLSDGVVTAEGYELQQLGMLPFDAGSDDKCFHLDHSIIIAPEVIPAPKETISTLSPFFSFPSV
jgi:putative phosphoesterase